MIYNRNNFSIASLCSCESRYYLDGVHVTPDYTEATNGHYLVRVATPFKGKDLKEALKNLPEVVGHKPKKDNSNGLESGFTFPRTAVVEVERSIPKSYMKQLENAWITENTTDEEAEFVSYDLETVRPIKARKIEGQWPNADTIMKHCDKPEMTLGFNPDYMLKICQVFKKMKLKAVRLDLYGEKKAMRMIGKTEEGQEVIVLLMPMVTDIEAPKEKSNTKKT